MTHGMRSHFFRNTGLDGVVFYNSFYRMPVQIAMFLAGVFFLFTIFFLIFFKSCWFKTYKKPLLHILAGCQIFFQSISSLLGDKHYSYFSSLTADRKFFGAYNDIAGERTKF